jgi:hypothetical protein
MSYDLLSRYYTELKYKYGINAADPCGFPNPCICPGVILNPCCPGVVLNSSPYTYGYIPYPYNNFYAGNIIR